MLQQQFEKNQNQKSPNWLSQIRKDNFATYLAQGLPTVRDEHWKYTNVKPIAKKEFKIAQPEQTFDTLPYTQNLDAINIFIINGHYHAMFHSNIDGLTIKSLSNAIQENAPSIKKLTQLTKTLNHGFAALNNAFINDGVYLNLEKNVVVDKPIHIFYINTNTESVQYHRNLFIINEGSQATLIEHFCSRDSKTYQSNSISEIYLNENAHLQHIKIQDEDHSAYHIGSTQVHQTANSYFGSYVLSFGGKISRSDTNIVLAENGACCDQYGLYLAKQRQHFDHHTFVGHEKPHGTSNQLYKGIIADSARAVFNGSVYVHPHAIKTDSAQMNKNLLLSDKAEIDTKPELEIYNDDVKCSHGATVGKLDKSQLFYLQSRGLDNSTAESILMFAFCYEIIKPIKNIELQTYLRNCILQNLPEGEAVRGLLK